MANHLACSMAPSTSPASLPQTPKAAHSINSSSPWNELPLYSDNLSSIETSSLPWLAYPEMIAQCPDTPESPLDILYGSRTNMLANVIHTFIERRPVRDPERLAMGLIIYHFSKWIIEPSPKTFAKLPTFTHPLQEQFEIEHPIAISSLPYPKLRSNLVHQWPLYENNRDELFGLLACSVKIRWPWGVKILDRDEDNQIRIKPAFYETFMKEEGWGLMQEFINKHPNLMVGVDVGSLVFNIVWSYNIFPRYHPWMYLKIQTFNIIDVSALNGNWGLSQSWKCCLKPAFSIWPFRCPHRIWRRLYAYLRASLQPVDRQVPSEEQEEEATTGVRLRLISITRGKVANMGRWRLHFRDNM